MKSMELIGIKCKITIRKNLLNFLLLIFSPRNKVLIALSQDLDKYIVLYQKELFSKYNKFQYNENLAA